MALAEALKVNISLKLLKSPFFAIEPTRSCVKALNTGHNSVHFTPCPFLAPALNATSHSLRAPCGTRTAHTWPAHTQSTCPLQRHFLAPATPHPYPTRAAARPSFPHGGARACNLPLAPACHRLGHNDLDDDAKKALKASVGGPGFLAGISFQGKNGVRLEF